MTVVLQISGNQNTNSHDAYRDAIRCDMISTFCAATSTWLKCQCCDFEEIGTILENWYKATQIYCLELYYLLLIQVKLCNFIPKRQK